VSFDPYAPPQSDVDPSAPSEPQPSLLPGAIFVFLVAIFGAVARVAVIQFASLDLRVLVGVATGATAAYLARKDPNRQWPVISGVACMVGLAFTQLLRSGDDAAWVSLKGTPASLFAATWIPLRTLRKIGAATATRARDDDQRALFARPLPPPPKPTQMRARIACAKCGELAYEDELRVGRICAGCAQA
jgi:hypothetical protein